MLPSLALLFIQPSLLPLVSCSSENWSIEEFVSSQPISSFGKCCRLIKWVSWGNMGPNNFWALYRLIHAMKDNWNYNFRTVVIQHITYKTLKLSSSALQESIKWWKQSGCLLRALKMDTPVKFRYYYNWKINTKKAVDWVNKTGSKFKISPALC